MNSEEAKRILLAWRPDTPDANDPEVAQALALSERDPQLRDWLEQHRAFQNSMRRAFRETPVPPGLARKILAAPTPSPAREWPRRPLLWAAAALLLLFVGGAALWTRPTREDSFAMFRSRMVSRVLRQYNMDWVTNDMTAIRRHLAAGNAPANYSLPSGLVPLPALGAGLLSWQDRRVSMVCLDSTNNGTLFLFVVDRSSVWHPPKSAPEFAPVNRLVTASWSQGEETYLLAMSGPMEDLRKYFETTAVPLR